MELAQRGAAVTLVARNKEALARVRAELPTDSGQSHDAVSVDFSDPEAVRQATADHVKSKGPVQILVNNTGGPPSGPIVDATPEAFRSAYSNHVVCNQLLMQTLLPGMKESGYGRIVNIISTSVFQPIKGLGVSNTTRAAVANWARTVASELGQFGITVNNVLPGYTDTERLKSLISKKAERTGVTEEQVLKEWINSIPVGRLGAPTEIAAAVGFLASPAASYVNGVSLLVDGGRLAAN